MLIVIHSGVVSTLVCDGCQGTAFQISSESQGGMINAFRTRCISCGKRGALTTSAGPLEFLQFGDPQGDVAIINPANA